MPQFDHDGIQFNYGDEGSGLPFVFQHGLGAEVSQPFSIFKPPPGIRLIAFDLRGHGLTAPLGDPEKLCFRVFGEDLAALLDHLGLERAVVGGISMGAALALHFAVRWPARVAGLVVSRPAWLEAPCPYNVKMFGLVSRLLRKHGATQGLIEFQQTKEYLETLARWPDVAESHSGQFMNPRVEETAAKFERIIQDTPHPNRSAWAAIQVPTLILANRLDPVHPFDYAEELARAIPGAAFRELTPKSKSLQQHKADVQHWLDEYFETHFLKVAPR